MILLATDFQTAKKIIDKGEENILKSINQVGYICNFLPGSKEILVIRSARDDIKFNALLIGKLEELKIFLKKKEFLYV